VSSRFRRRERPARLGQPAGTHAQLSPRCGRGLRVQTNAAQLPLAADAALACARPAQLKPATLGSEHAERRDRKVTLGIRDLGIGGNAEGSARDLGGSSPTLGRDWRRRGGFPRASVAARASCKRRRLVGHGADRRDERWRPVQPGTSTPPVASAAAARQGLLLGCRSADRSIARAPGSSGFAGGRGVRERRER
jgi:hypothetical protein